MNNHIDFSCSYTIDTIVPGHLFLWNTFEIRNKTTHNYNLTLFKK